MSLFKKIKNDDNAPDFSAGNVLYLLYAGMNRYHYAGCPTSKILYAQK